MSNKHYGASNHWKPNCLLKTLYGLIKKASELHIDRPFWGEITGIWKGNPLVTNKFPSQRPAMGLLPDTSIWICECAGNYGNVFPATAGKRSRHALRHVRHAHAVMPGSLTRDFFFSWWREHSRRMRKLQFYVSNKSPWRTRFHVMTSSQAWQCYLSSCNGTHSILNMMSMRWGWRCTFWYVTEG